MAYAKSRTPHGLLASRIRLGFWPAPPMTCKLIDAKFGSMPIAALEDRRARGDFKAFRNSFADTPRKADYLSTTIARVLSVAKDHGKISVNVCERGGRLYDADRPEIIWTADDIRGECS
jgi:hypothetical protein